MRKRNRVRRLRGCLVMALCALISFAPAPWVGAGRSDKLGAATTTIAGSAKRQHTENEVDGYAVMWEVPSDLESRDLFYGIGGRKGAPDPAGSYRFVKRDRGGTSEKIIVEDEHDRVWTVKFGLEPRPETTATRIVWAAGYHTDQDYFVETTYIQRGKGGFAAHDVRFELDNDGFKKVDRWDWESNRFVGTRELDGLKTLMALLNNFDLKKLNNKIVRPAKKKSSEKTKLIYYVNDLGATLGSTGIWMTQLPLLGELPAGTKGIAKHFAEHQFIDEVTNGEVVFYNKRKRALRALAGVKVENARWMGDLLARLSDRQWIDAFRAGGFNEQETAIYLRAIRDRIRQLQNLQREE